MLGPYAISGGKVISHSWLDFAVLPMQQNNSNTHLRFQGYGANCSCLIFFFPLSFCPLCHSWIKAVLATPTLVVRPLQRGEERQAKIGEQLWVLGSCWLMLDENDAPGRVSFGMVGYTCCPGLWTNASTNKAFRRTRYLLSSRGHNESRFFFRLN